LKDPAGGRLCDGLQVRVDHLDGDVMRIVQVADGSR